MFGYLSDNFKAMNKPKLPDYVFLLRPLILVPVWAYAVFGYFQKALSSGTTVELGFWKIVPLNWEFPLILLLYSLLFGAILILNQITDCETDKLQPGIWLIASNKFPKKTAVVEMVIITTIALIGSFFFFPAALIFFFTLFLGIVYCVPPFRFSGKPVFDFITNAIGYGFAPFVLGWTAAGGDFDWAMIRASAPYVLLMAAGAVNSTIPDIEDDAKTGKITTSVKWGARKASALGIFFLLGSINLSIIFKDYYCLAMGLVSFAFFAKALVRDTRVDYLKTLHIAGPFVMFLAGAVYPPMILAMIAVYFAARWYYPWRFGVDYPKAGK